MRVMIVGTREGIMEQIRIFYNKGVAEVDAWIALLPVPNSSELMSILTRWRKGTNTKKSGGQSE